MRENIRGLVFVLARYNHHDYTHGLQTVNHQVSWLVDIDLNSI